jgi:hypothetical protein
MIFKHDLYIGLGFGALGVLFEVMLLLVISKEVVNFNISIISDMFSISAYAYFAA